MGFAIHVHNAAAFASQQNYPHGSKRRSEHVATLFPEAYYGLQWKCFLVLLFICITWIMHDKWHIMFADVLYPSRKNRTIITMHISLEPSYRTKFTQHCFHLSNTNAQIWAFHYYCCRLQGLPPPSSVRRIPSCNADVGSWSLQRDTHFP